MIYLVGHKGRLGSELIKLGATPTDGSFLESDVLINCVSKSDYQFCEDNPIEAYRSNVDFIGGLMRFTKPKLIHISSDYCDLDGYDLHRESPLPIYDQLSVYTKTKLAAEILFDCHAVEGRHTCIRSSAFFGPGKRAWFDYPKVWEQRVNPTYIPDFAKALMSVARRMEQGEVPPLRMNYGTVDNINRIVLSENNRPIPIPKGRPMNSGFDTSPWILERYSRMKLEECINEYRAWAKEAGI